MIDICSDSARKASSEGVRLGVGGVVIGEWDLEMGRWFELRLSLLL